MSVAPARSEAVRVLPITPSFRRSDARTLSRRVGEGLRGGVRCFVLDLTGATFVSEGVLVLALLGLRSELHRNHGRLVVAAEPELARRVGMSLRLDDVLGAASSRAEAVEHAAATSPAGGVACERCGAAWHDGRRALTIIAARTCARCGGRLADGTAGNLRRALAPSLERPEAAQRSAPDETGEQGWLTPTTGDRH